MTPTEPAILINNAPNPNGRPSQVGYGRALFKGCATIEAETVIVDAPEVSLLGHQQAVSQIPCDAYELFSD
jgi:hypothetical protein